MLPPLILEMIRELAEFERKDADSMPLNANTLHKFTHERLPRVYLETTSLYWF